MSVELQPLGVSCHASCKYCYQEPIRDAGNTNPRGKYDIDRIIDQGLKVGGPLTMFGGEGLLVPIEDLEKVFAASHAKYKKTSIQTNGDLITNDHIELFRKYNVGVGVSIDGPGILNSLRPRRSDGNWEEPTAKTMENLVKLRQAGVAVSIIATLHRENGTPERLPIFKEWGLWLASIGIHYVNIHPLESENWMIKEKYALRPAEDVAAMLDLAEWLETQRDLHWVPFQSMKEMLAGDSQGASCVWHFCDPMTTAAVQAVLGDGSMANCGRTSKDGVPWVKPGQAGYERYISLYHTPQDLGGCRDCRFFVVCGGECPGTGWGSEGPDWRLKTDHCSMLMALFAFYEQRIATPISLHPQRSKIESTLIRMFTNGKRPNSLTHLVTAAEKDNTSEREAAAHEDAPHGDSHGDHFDAVASGEVVTPHGDTPHGDLHGDSFKPQSTGQIGMIRTWDEYSNAH